MASKEVLKHNGNTVPEINDSANAPFGGYEVYSREKVDELLQALTLSGGHDWSGRVLCFEGESLTANTTTAYPAYVAEQLGATEKVIAISGKVIYPDLAGDISDFRRRVSNIPADVDAIVIMGDCNAKYQVDDPDSVNYYTYDTSTWCGRWNTALAAIKRSFPTVPVFLVVQYAAFDDTNYTIKYVKCVTEGFWRFASWHGAIYINLPTETPLNPHHAPSVWGLTDTDKIHVNHEAMPLFADVIIRHMKQLPPPVWQGTDTISIAESSVEVQVGKTVKLTVTQTGDLSCQWTSNNMDVACVMGGVVYGMAPGTATITAKTRNGNTASCTVTVTE